MATINSPLLQPRGDADFDLYPYTPSQSAGYAFVALFGIGAIVHLIMLVPLRSWFYIPFVLGCVGKSPPTRHQNSPL